ncbi:hypothetical protein [Nakamurella lactea]|uniref:hypothetical protein n=1 Tax=Nakamurella lactea TaxID=459515 RepID=UPI000425BD30|nr:hypothetical protein [Nakamurella lactea]
MRTAVIRVGVDAAGELTSDRYADGIRQLRGLGYQVVAPPSQTPPGHRREIEVVVQTADPGALADTVAAAAGTAFGTDCTAGVMTFVSRGTDDDVLGVLAGFGLAGVVHRSSTPDGELVTVTLPATEQDRVPESRVHTALVSALNSEVRLVFG